MKIRYHKKILFVEDEELVREVTAIYLKRVFAECYYAQNGEDGLAKFVEYKPDIVMTDIEMPKMDGLTMSQKIKMINPDAKIVIATAYNDDTKESLAKELGVYAYLVKPVDYDELDSIFKAIFGE